MSIRARYPAPLKLVMLLALGPLAAGASGDAHDLAETSLEDLMNIEVTTVSKKEQKLSRAPAAVYVITQEDIRRSGMTTIPDLLRMAPGVQVGQMQSGVWGVSARGFNSQNSDKMLVLVDGRSIYSPINKGVFWDEQDILLEDIERIEVIRGPGATMWGSNAVNGVVNIITRRAEDTQGSLVTAGGGDQGQALGGLRFGGAVGEAGYYRVFSKWSDGNDLRTGGLTLNSAQSLHSGVRADLTLSGKDSLTVEGDLFHTVSGSAIDLFQPAPPFDNIVSASSHGDGGSVMANWSHTQSDRSRTQLRVYLNRSLRSSILQSSKLSTVDFDFQHEIRLGDSHELVWGLGYRESLSDVSIGSAIAFLPPYRDDRLFSAFIQDQWKIAGDRLSLLLGSRFEHYNFSGYNAQPSARLLWTPDARHTLWLAVSRALRTPSYSDQAVRANLENIPPVHGIPGIVMLLGNPSFRSESLLSYELGYRLQAGRRASFDVATFYSRYRHLRTAEPLTPYASSDPEPVHVVAPFELSNGLHGESWGGEISSNLKVTSHWRLIPGYSFLRLDLRNDPTSMDTVGLNLQTQSPRHQFQVRSNLDLSRRVQFDADVYYTGSLPGYNISAYTRLDARLGYRPHSNVELSIAGRNLQGGMHQELISLGPYLPATISRSVFSKVTWEF